MSGKIAATELITLEDFINNCTDVEKKAIYALISFAYEEGYLKGLNDKNGGNKNGEQHERSNV